MKLTNLSNGLIVNNYKDLCKLLEIPVKTGDAKIAQLKEIERYIDYDKDKNKFIIEEVYSEPLPEDNNITKYREALEKLLLHFMVNSINSDNRVYIRKDELMVLLGMLNEKYAKYKYKQLSLKTHLKVSKESVMDFYKSSSRSLNRNLENALNSLQKQSLIKWGNVFTVDEVLVEGEKLVQKETKDKYGNTVISFAKDIEVKHTHREATVEETEYILSLQKKLLREMGLKELSQIYEIGKVEYFYKTVKDVLLSERKIANYYDSFSLIFNKKDAILEYELLDSLVLNEELKTQMSELLNTNILERNNFLANSRHKKAIKSGSLDRLDKKRRTKKYVKDSIKINNTLITQ